MIRTSSDLDTHWQRFTTGNADEPIGYILAMEGADPIVEPSQAVEWWNLGLRSVNLAHYGKSRYAVGTGDDGPLTPEGVQLLKEFEQLGMILDATHLSDTSFYQALDIFHGPVLASHNNCRALVPDGRQFTDEQIRLLIERDAVIGSARCLDALPGWVRGQTSRRSWGWRRWPIISTMSASLPAATGMPRSAAIWTAATAPSRAPLAWTGSRTFKIWARSWHGMDTPTA